MKVMVVVRAEGVFKNHVGRIVINKEYDIYTSYCTSPDLSLRRSSFCADWKIVDEEIVNTNPDEWTLEPLNDKNVSLVEGYYKESLEKILRYGESYET